VITGNTFTNNSAPFGGAIYITADTTDPDPATAAPTIVTKNTFTGNIAKGSSTAPPGGGAIFVEYWGNLRLDTPDSNTYSGNDPNDIFYTMPPSG
jgi:predicted outer membrane repeat protein